MVPTNRPCGKCGAPGLVFIPAYQRHYCRVCSQYE
jgi:ssDNA-binding Zn-finger/Zn-ribbon topoisomerase 1